MTDRIDDLVNRMRAIEDQLKLVCEMTGTPFHLDRPEVPEEVRLLIEEGKRIEAVKRYVELTGADLKEAARIVGQY